MGGSTSGKLLKHGSAYVFYSIFSKLAAFLILPIVTKYLSIDEYGVYSNLLAMQNVLTGFAMLGLDAAYGRYLYVYNSPRKLKLLTSTITMFFMVWSVFFFIVSVFLINFLLKSWEYKNGSEVIYISILLPVIILAKQYSMLNTFLMQSTHRTRDILFINSTGVIAVQVFILIFLIGMRFNVMAIFASQILVYLCIFFVHLRIMIRKDLIKLFYYSRYVLIKNLKYGLGFLPSILGLWVFTSSDRFFITYMISTEATGKFAFLAQFSMLIMTIVQAVAVVYWPIYLNLMKQKDTNENQSKIEAFIFLSIYVIILMFLGICIFTPVLVELLFVDDYQGDYVVLYILTLSAFFLAFRKIFAQTLGHFKKALWLSASSYVPALLNVVLNIFLIPVYGIYGAAYATLISVIVYALVVFWMSQSLYPVRLEKIKLFGIFFLALCLVGVSYIYSGILVGISLVLVYLYAGWVFNFHQFPNKL